LGDVVVVQFTGEFSLLQEISAPSGGIRTSQGEASEELGGGELSKIGFPISGLSVTRIGLSFPGEGVTLIGLSVGGGLESDVGWIGFTGRRVILSGSRGIGVTLLLGDMDAGVCCGINGLLVGLIRITA